MTITPKRIAEALDVAPAWAVIALTMPGERLRNDARRELGEHIYHLLFDAADPVGGQRLLPSDRCAD